MPRRTVPGSDFGYHLLLFDDEGHERKEADGRRYSQHVLEHETAGVTDVFVLSHGWMGDIPAAINQYDRWVGVMLRQERDLQRMRSTVPDFKPLVVCVHWPSLPWGVERVGAALLGGEEEGDEFETEEALDAAGLIDLYAPRIADTAETRRALATIMAVADNLDDADNLALAETASHTGELPQALTDAYRTLFEQAGLQYEGAVGPPDADQASFTPGATIETWAKRDGDDANAPAVLGFGDDLVARLKKAKEALLNPVRQISFWTMKKRARVVGQAGVHDLLVALQRAAEDARMHLMGHSFGCIVVSSAIAGPHIGDHFDSPLPRPVDAVLLAQGAMSLWSYAEKVSFAANQPGYFRELVDSGRIGGPLLITKSEFDTAVGKFYPLGAQIGGDILLGDDDLPRFGGLGTWGAQGVPASEIDILAPSAEYGLRRADVLNVDAARVIRNGTGPAGAHNDIAHPDVAHLMWQAVLGSQVQA
jgi:hypothetical protein